MAKKERLEIKASEIRDGDMVSAEGATPFKVAGVRRNPDDERRVRLFSEDNVMQAELEPETLVEVER